MALINSVHKPSFLIQMIESSPQDFHAYSDPRSTHSEWLLFIFCVNSHLQPRGTPLLKWQQEPTLPAGLAGAQWNPRGPPRRPPPPLSRKSPPLTNHCRYRRHSTSNWTLHSWKRPSPNWDMTRMEKYLPHFWSDRKPTRQYQVDIGSNLYISSTIKN